MTRRNEGLRRADAGSTDSEGFIAPSIGLVDHALYFTTAPDVFTKTLQILDAQRLELPGAVIVWDETIGRRKGAKAVPGSWWAGDGSVTMTLVFPHFETRTIDDTRSAVGAAVLAAVESFAPSRPVSYSDGEILLDGKRLGEIKRELHEAHEIFIVRVNANTDFSAAPNEVQISHGRLSDYIDTNSLPLGTAKTLPNSLSKAIMTAVPTALGYV